MNNQKYTIDEIVEAKFKKKMFGGLKPADVDEFLNGVIDDYEYFISKITELKKNNDELRDENFKVKMSVLKQATHTIDLSEEVELKEAKALVEEENATHNRLEELDTIVEATDNQEFSPIIDETPIQTTQKETVEESKTDSVTEQEEIKAKLEQLLAEMENLKNK